MVSEDKLTTQIIDDLQEKQAFGIMKADRPNNSTNNSNIYGLSSLKKANETVSEEPDKIITPNSNKKSINKIDINTTNDTNDINKVKNQNKNIQDTLQDTSLNVDSSDSSEENNEVPLKNNEPNKEEKSIQEKRNRMEEMHDKIHSSFMGSGFILFSAMVISVLSAYLTIHGYTGLFIGGYAVSVGIMLGALEISKFTIASIILTSKEKMKQKPYLILIMLFLVSIAFIGHYSYLSKAYYTNKIDIQVTELRTEIIDDRLEQIKVEISGMKELYESFDPVKFRTKRLEAYNEVKPKIDVLQQEQLQLFEEKRMQLETLTTDESKDVGSFKYTSELLGIEADLLANIIIISLSLIIDPLGLLLASLAMSIRRKKKELEHEYHILEEEIKK